MGVGISFCHDISILRFASLPKFETLTMSALHFAIIPVTPFAQNCTLLWDEVSKRGAIVDPGGDMPVSF